MLIGYGSVSRITVGVNSSVFPFQTPCMYQSALSFWASWMMRPLIKALLYISRYCRGGRKSLPVTQWFPLYLIGCPMTISTTFYLFSPISTGSRSEEALNVTWVELQSVGKPYPTPVSLLTLSSLHSLKLHSHISYTPQTRYTHSVP